MKSYLEYKDSSSEKFWEVSVKGKTLTTRWGKLDTQGQSKSKELESLKLAKAEAEKQAASKIKKGYKAVTVKKASAKKKAPAKKLTAKEKTPVKKASAKKKSVFNPKEASESELMIVAQDESSSEILLADLVDFLLDQLGDKKTFFDQEKWRSANRILETLCWNKSLSLESVLLLLEKKNFYIGGAMGGNDQIKELIGTALLQHPSLPPDKIEEIASTRKEEFILRAIACSPRTPVAVLERFAKGRKSSLKSAMKANPNLPQSIRDKIAGKAKSAPKKKMVSKKKLEMLEERAKDEDWRVRKGVAENPNTPVALLEQLAKDKDEWVCRAVVANPNTPVTSIKRLAKHKAKGVREVVAENPNTSGSVLEVLAKDEGWRVRRNVAKHANTSGSVLELLAKDEDSGVRSVAAFNPNTPAALRELLEKDRDKRAKKFYQMKEKLWDLGWFVKWTMEDQINHVYEDFWIGNSGSGREDDPDKMLVSYTGFISDYMTHLEDVEDDEVFEWYDTFELAYLRQDLVSIEKLTQSDLGKRLKLPTPEHWGEGWFLASVSEQGLKNLEELRRVITESGCREGQKDHPYGGSDYEETSIIHIQW